MTISKYSANNDLIEQVFIQFLLIHIKFIWMCMAIIFVDQFIVVCFLTRPLNDYYRLCDFAIAELNWSRKSSSERATEKEVKEEYWLAHFIKAIPSPRFMLLSALLTCETGCEQRYILKLIHSINTLYAITASQ